MFTINQITKTAIIMLLASVILVPIAWNDAHAYGESNARALGMGGSHTALARNYHTLQYNPANLGLLEGNHGVAVQMFSIGTQLKNNTFSYGDYNKYTGAYLTRDDKETILSKIPAEGLTLKATAEGGATSFSTGHFAFSATGYASSSVNLPKDPVELILYGNAYVPTLDLGTTRGEAWGVADFGFGYGHTLRTWENGELAVGASFHYLKGIIYEKIIHAEGYAETGDTAIMADGNMIVRSATGGSGYSFDIGMATRFNTDYVFSFAILNFVNKLRWNNEPELTTYTFEMKPLNSNSIDEDSLTVSNDTTVATESFGQKKPAIVKLGLSSTYSGILWAVDWEQGFSNTAASSANPRISGGLEYRALSWLPVRTGLSFGGLIGGYAAIGFGLDLGPYNFDFALANQGSILPSGAKGLLFSLSSDFRF
ncbi:MAG: hypothetical protein GY855_09980 [candidate division Zixibacteria bacterium]|nr:hypothetical protein [candidate division Zixibacteria bacterium]